VFNVLEKGGVVCLLYFCSSASQFYSSHTKWKNLTNSFCGGSKMSPIDIVTKNVTTDPNLGNFNLNGFNSKDVFTSIMNNGHTVKVSGGGLSGTYTGLQFHFHWGDGNHPGSEHTVDEHRYPMEMHIVTQKDHLTAPREHPDGYAVLGFFINVSILLENLTSYLSKIHNIMMVTYEISIDDLLGNVNRHDYYRYSGSLTTHLCNQAVVWTVFKEPVNVDLNLVNQDVPQTNRIFQCVSAHTAPASGHGTSESASSASRPLLCLLLLACLCVYFI
uniref:Carbonic anhydrase n=1 Tax=Pundamilia nyererei TaxID=303518 RepID=A0A3B4H069_9CICH